MKNKSRTSRKGFSVVELMVVMGLFVIIGVIVSNLFLNTQKSFTHTSARINARKEASRVLRTLEKELRQISQASEDFEAIELADQNQLVFYADIDNDEKPEKISYSLDGQRIIKAVTRTSNEAAPWEFEGAVTNENLTTYSVNSLQVPVFTYYSAMDETLSQLPLDSTDRQSVKIIRIDIRVKISDSAQKSDNFETEVYLRNKNDPL